MAKAAKISAYLQIFDDWDALPQALSAIDPLVDEIVVVDGAYEWIAPALGNRDPTRSRDEVYDALAPYSHKTRIINRTWGDEFEKRQFGYDACRNKYVLRVDSDEVFFFNEEKLDEFFRSGKSIASVNLTAFVTPEYYYTNTHDPTRLCTLFDSERVTARRHLNYLWLVLPKELKQERSSWEDVFNGVIAFVPHLTNWRTPFCATSRGMFYYLLHKKNHSPEGAELQIDPNYRTLLLGANIIAGGPLNLGPGWFVKSPLSESDTAKIASVFERQSRGLAELNESLREGREIYNRAHYHIDLSTELSSNAMAERLTFSGKLNGFSARLHSVRNREVSVTEEALSYAIEGDSVVIDIPPYDGELRRTLIIDPDVEGGEIVSMTASKGAS